MSHRARGGLTEGALVLGALLLVPFSFLAALRTPLGSGFHDVAVVLVEAAAVAYAIVVIGVARLVVAQLRHGAAPIESGPIAWAAVRIATFVLVIAPFLESGSQHASHRMSAAQHLPRSTAMVPAVSPREPRVTVVGAPVAAAADQRGPGSDGLHAPRRARGGHRGVVAPPSLGSGSIIIGLAAELRRRTRMWRRVLVDDDRAVDLETTLLCNAPIATTSLLVATARSLAAAGRLSELVHVVIEDSSARVDDASWLLDPSAPAVDVRCLLVVLGELGGATHVLFAPRGATLGLAGPGAASLIDDALRVAPALGLGRPVRAAPGALLRSLATRGDDDLVVAVGGLLESDPELLEHCVRIDTQASAPHATVTPSTVLLEDGRVLTRSSLAPTVRELLDGAYDDQPIDEVAPSAGGRQHLLGPIEDHGAVVRLLTAIPRVDGLVEPLESSRERRAVELVAYLALRAGEPVTGERLRVRVLGTTSSDAAAKTLFNIASSLRRALGDGPFGARLPPAGRLSRYAVAPDVVCDASVLEAWVARAHASDEPDEKMAWLRAALELIEGEPFATVLEGYDWFLTEGHLTRLQVICEDAACELVQLALAEGLVDLARLAIDRALLVDPYSEALAAAAALVAAARQASFAAMEPAVRSTLPSAPVVT